jgi:hypothetical protein
MEKNINMNVYFNIINLVYKRKIFVYYLLNVILTFPSVYKFQ